MELKLNLGLLAGELCFWLAITWLAVKELGLSCRYLEILLFCIHPYDDNLNQMLLAGVPYPLVPVTWATVNGKPKGYRSQIMRTLVGTTV